MLSMLFSGGGEIPHPDKKLEDDLLLDAALAEICPDIRKRQIFLTVLTNPLTEPDEISFRAEILRDFIAAPNLCESLRGEFNALLRLRDEAQRERSRAYTVSRSTDSDAALRSTLLITNLYAQTAEKALHLVSQIELVLRMYNIRSAGLDRIRRRAADFRPGADEAAEICRTVANYHIDDYAASARLAIGEDGRIDSCRMTALERRIATEAKSGKLRKLFAKAPAREPGVVLSDPFGQHKNQLFSAAFAGMGELFDQLARGIFDEFCPLARELSFYEAALAYVKAMKAKNIPLCTPAISDTTEIHGLYDLLLAAQYPGAEGIVPNDIIFASRAGIIITGENNSGKTVFLRSVGCAQLFFQAGLPIPAREAKLRPRSAVYTRYAAAEKEFCAGNDAGRFEQEVRELAPLIESIKPDSLLLLNEIFQTTAYSEGAEGLYNILRYLSRRGASFILVTHLRELLGSFGGDIVHMTTGEGYHISVCGRKDV